MISHVVVLSTLRHRLYLIKSLMISQFHFQRRVNLCDQSCRCRVSTLSQITHCSISIDNLVSYFADITPPRSVMSLSYQLFVIDRILFDRSSQFIFYFYVNRTYTISQVGVLSGLRHTSYPVRLIMTIHFRFRYSVDQYDRSYHCPFIFSSQTDPI